MHPLRKLRKSGESTAAQISELLATKLSKEWILRNELSELRLIRFVLYSLRHTFLTRIGESGCDAWTLARIAGHSSVSISARYVHPSEDAVLNAMSRLQQEPRIAG